MSGTLLPSSPSKISTQTSNWINKYDKEADTLHQGQDSALEGVRDFGLEEAAYVAARGTVRIVKGAHEEEQTKGYEPGLGMVMREVNGRLIIPGHGPLRPMRVVRERRSAPEISMKSEAETGEVAFRREFLGSSRGRKVKDVYVEEKKDLEEKKDVEGGGQEMPEEVAFRMSFFGSLRGLRDGAIARLGFRKDEKKVTGSDVETDEERPITPKKQ